MLRKATLLVFGSAVLVQGGARKVSSGVVRADPLGSCRYSSLHTSKREFRFTQCLLQSWAKQGSRRWMCAKEDCHHVNKPSDQTCSECGEAKPKLLGWKCVLCKTENHSGVKRCKSCGGPFEASKDFWMCAACKENNRIDEVEDNSVCGFCGYDMAPLSRNEEDIMRQSEEREMDLRSRQEQFDSIGAEEAEMQFGSPVAGSAALPPHLSRPAAPRRNARMLPTEGIPAFTPPSKRETSHSRIHRRRTMSAVHQEVASAVPEGPPGFDWMCRKCHHINAGDEENCMKCSAHIDPCDWECPQCAAINHLSRSRCFNCHSAIPVCWECMECGKSSSIYESACHSCGTPRPKTEPKLAFEIDRPSFPVTSQGRQKKGDWYCEACNAMNFSRRTECFQCGAARSVHLKPEQMALSNTAESGFFEDGGEDAGFHKGHNNWYCRFCQASNFRTRVNCWQCGRESSDSQQRTFSHDGAEPHFEKEGFQEGAESSSAHSVSQPAFTSPFKANEWTCAKCFTKNFGSRRDCFKCGIPKTVVLPTRRTSVRKPVKL